LNFLGSFICIICWWTGTAKVLTQKKSSNY